MYEDIDGPNPHVGTNWLASLPGQAAAADPPRSVGYVRDPRCSRGLPWAFYYTQDNNTTVRVYQDGTVFAAPSAPGVDQRLCSVPVGASWAEVSATVDTALHPPPARPDPTTTYLPDPSDDEVDALLAVSRFARCVLDVAAQARLAGYQVEARGLSLVGTSVPNGRVEVPMPDGDLARTRQGVLLVLAGAGSDPVCRWAYTAAYGKPPLGGVA